MYRKSGKNVEVFLVHPGGPFWKHKDIGAWSIPKGEPGDNEDPLDAAIREVQEETGFAVSGDFIPLRPARQKSGKTVVSWALEMDVDPRLLVSNTFSLEWPPRSGKFIDVPEVDRGDWFSKEEARNKINPGQLSILDELYEILSA